MANTVEIIIQGEDKASKELDKVNRSLKETDKQLDKTDKKSRQSSKGLDLMGTAAKAAAGALSIYMVKQAAKAVIELGKLAAEAEQLERSLSNLAGGAREAERYINAVQNASKGAISEMDAMQMSTTALTLGVVENADQMERLTEIAITLGKAQGLTATKAVSDLTTALGRQSPMILDNLGITMSLSDAHRAYADQLGKSVDELTDAEKEQSFLNAALEEGEKVAAKLGGVMEDNQTQIEQGTAAWKDLRVEIGRNFSKAVGDASGATAGFARSMADALKNTRETYEYLQRLRERGLDPTTRSTVGLTKSVQDQGRSLQAVTEGWEEYGGVQEGLIGKLGEQEEPLHRVTQGWEEYGGAIGVVAAKTRTAGDATQPLKDGLDDVGEASGRNTDLIRGAADALADQAGAALDLAAGLKDATEAEVGKELIGMLDPKEMGAEDYRTAVEGIGLAFGIMDEKSIALADNLPKLADALEDGVIPAEDAHKAMSDLMADAEDGVVNFGNLETKYGNVIDRTPDLIEKLEGADERMGFLKDSAGEAAGKVESLAVWAEKATMKLNEMPEDKFIEIHYELSTTGSAPSDADDPDLPEFQSGGPVMRDRPYIVGEAGPELFVPNTSGQIIPNSQMGAGGGGAGGGGGSTNINVHIGSFMASDSKMVDELAQKIAHRVQFSGGYHAPLRKH